MAHVGRVGGEHSLGDVDLHWVQAPGAHAAEQVGVAELVLTGDGVLDVAEGSVEGEDPVGLTGVDHPGDGVVPEVLLVRGALALDVTVHRVLSHQVPRVATTDASGLHAPVGGEVGRAQRQALHAGRGAADLLHVGHAPRCLEDGVHQERLREPRLGLELGEEPVHVVDVLGPLHLGDHDDVQLLARLEDRGGEVVEAPGRVERVHAGPELRVRGGPRLGHLDQTRPGGLLVCRWHAVFEVAEEDVDGGGDVGDLGHHLRVGPREEVDHPRRGERDLPERLRRSDGEGAEEVLGAAHQASTVATMRRAMTFRQSVSSAPSKMERTRASTKYRLTSYSSA